MKLEFIKVATKVIENDEEYTSLPVVEDNRKFKLRRAMQGAGIGGFLGEGFIPADYRSNPKRKMLANAGIGAVALGLPGYFMGKRKDSTRDKLRSEGYTIYKKNPFGLFAANKDGNMLVEDRSGRRLIKTNVVHEK